MVLSHKRYSYLQAIMREHDAPIRRPAPLFLRAVAAGIVGAATLATPLAAQSRYDLKLEKAAMEVIARKIGNLRLAPVDGHVPVVVLPRANVVAPLLGKVSVGKMRAGPAWHVARSDEEMRANITGSIQSFSDGVEMTPEERRAQIGRTVTRLANY